MTATGAGTDSNIDINGSSLTVNKDALFQADNDLNINGVAQNSNTRSDNKSSSTAIGAYAATNPGKGASYGITANASRAKGYANSDSTTYANSQVNVGGTSTFDIGNDVNIKGGVLNTDKIQGIIGGDMNIESLQDTAIYDSDQKNMGFSADLDLAKGTGSSLSVNGGKTNLTADYKAVGEQSGIFANQADIVAEGKGTVKGGVFVTSKEAQANGKSNIVFKQGVSSQDIKNITSYEGEALSIGLSIGNTTGKPQATMNGIGYGTDSDSDSSITKGGVSGYNDPQGILTTDNREALGGKLESVFDANRVNEELGAQTQITKDFGKEAPKAVAEFSQNRIDAIRANPNLSADEKMAAISKWDEGGIYRVAAHTVLGALGTGSVEGALTTGGVAAAAPTLNDIQAKVAKALIDKGMNEDIANGTASGVISLTLLGAGTAAGLDTSSTVTATNVDANNRQLHPSEIQFILDKDRVKRFADKYGLTEEEAKKALAYTVTVQNDYEWGNILEDHPYKHEAHVFMIMEFSAAGISGFTNPDDNFANETYNLKNLFDSADDPAVKEYLSLVFQDIDPARAQELLQKGRLQGATEANEQSSIQGDTNILLQGVALLDKTFIEAYKSDEVGPYDSPRMQSYYESLLKIQGRYEELGMIQGKTWNETQRLIWAGEIAGIGIGGVASQTGRLVGKVGDGVVKLHTPSNPIQAPNNSQTGAIGGYSSTESQSNTISNSSNTRQGTIDTTIRLPDASASKVLQEQHEKLGDYSYCTECAENLMEASSGQGKVIIFGSKDAKWDDGYSWGLNETSPNLNISTKTTNNAEYTYHSVYTDGKYIYDPFVSGKPIPQSDYIQMLKDQNPNGVSWRIKGETDSPDIPELKKGGF